MIRKILLITAVILVTFAQNNAFAQYPQENIQTEQENIQKEIGKGIHMTDTGKALLFTGASVAMTGVACFIGGAALFDPDPERPEMPLYPAYFIAGAATGGVIALIGLPFYVYGKGKMQKYGSSHIVFGDETQEGGAGFVEMGLGIPNFLSFDAVGGYSFGKNFFMGGGLGYKTYLTAGLRQEGALASLPIYSNFRYSIGKKRVVPYIGASVGYDIANTGLYTGAEFGTRFRKLEGNRGQSWWFGFRSEFTTSENMFISLKVGRSF